MLLTTVVDKGNEDAERRDISALNIPTLAKERFKDTQNFMQDIIRKYAKPDYYG